MARILIDTGAIGQSWAVKVLDELKDGPNVVFVESNDWKSTREKGRIVKLHEFLRGVKLKFGSHRVEIAPTLDVESHIKKIEAVGNWVSCAECDDPHVFAIVRVKSVHFVLTSEKRMDDCRRKMHGSLDRKYLAFRSINSPRNYLVHKVDLFA